MMRRCNIEDVHCYPHLRLDIEITDDYSANKI